MMIYQEFVYMIRIQKNIMLEELQIMLGQMELLNIMMPEEQLHYQLEEILM
jgi:hypothetical protein